MITDVVVSVRANKCKGGLHVFARPENKLLCQCGKTKFNAGAYKEWFHSKILENLR